MFRFLPKYHFVLKYLFVHLFLKNHYFLMYQKFQSNPKNHSIPKSLFRLKFLNYPTMQKFLMYPILLMFPSKYPKYLLNQRNQSQCHHHLRNQMLV
jgi:hypothetical protein